MAAIFTNVAADQRHWRRISSFIIKSLEKADRQIISVSEGVLGECLASMAQMNAEVFISKTDEMYVLRFYTGFEDIVVAVDDKGRYEISLVKDEMVA